MREPYEWDAGRIEGAIHIELEHLGANAAKIDTDRPVIFQCRLGARSMMAAQAFRGVGIDAYSMAGGLQRWVDEKRPIDARGPGPSPTTDRGAPGLSRRRRGTRALTDQRRQTCTSASGRC